MPHIHTQPGQIDFIAEVFIVHKDKVLLRLHDKYQIWIAPGGHVELDETPEVAAVREAKEEVGLDVKLWSEKKQNSFEEEQYQQLIPPVFMNVHDITAPGPHHRHLVMVYFATSASDQVVEPAGEEKSGGLRWMTREDLEKADDMSETVKSYALKALEVLGS